MRYPLDIWSTNRGPSGKVARFLFLVLAGFVAFVLAGVILQIGTYLFGTYVLEIGKCEAVVSRSIPAPSEERAVIVYRNVCNDVETVTTHASLAKNLDDFAENRPEPFFSAVELDVLHVKVSWRDETHVLFEILEEGRERAPLRVGDVDIEYRLRP